MLLPDTYTRSMYAIARASLPTTKTKMRLHLSSAAAASLLLMLMLMLMLPSSSEAKLGAPRRSPLPKEQQQLQQNIAIDPHPHHHQYHRSLSCHEHPGQFRYQTQTNGDVLTSCSRLILQVARGVVSASKISNKCSQPLVGLEDWYGPDATVADACPALCDRPCDGQHATAVEEDSPDIDIEEGDGDVVIRLPENDSNEDLIVEEPDIEQAEQHEEEEEQLEVSDEPMVELIEPNPIVDIIEHVEEQPVEEQPTSVVVESPSIIQTIQTQVEQELTESEDEEYGDMTPTIDLIAESEDEEEDVEMEIEKPTPTIATFEPKQRGNGKWGDEFDLTLIPIHTILLPDGQILSYGTSAKGRQGADLYYEVWDWNRGIHGSVHKLLQHETKADIFCSSLNVDPSNGNIIIMGGDVRSPDAGFGIETVLEYDVKAETVRTHPKGDMKYARWYGTSVNMPNGDIFVVGGRDDDKRGSPIPEIYSPDTGFRQLKGASIPIIAKEKTKNHWWYPHTYVNSNGDLIVIMPRSGNADIYRVDVDGDGSVTRIGRKPFEAHVRSPSIMFRTDQAAFLDDKGGLWVADISSSNSVSWDKKNSLGHGRTNGSMALLPDGRVVIVGGARSTDNGGSDIDKAEKSLHIWDPETNKLVRGDKENNARLYHSSALILPDTSVVSAGGGAPGPVRNRNGQLYHPDYFYDTKQQKVDRSKITESPRNIKSRDSFFIFVDDTSRVVKVTATKSGSSSHTRNCDTRWLDLSFDVVDETTLRVTAENKNIMIGGLWMLNLIDIHGVPSEGVLMGVDMAAI